MNAYEQAYEMLNPAQRAAVDTIDGPLLVIAGPGTGKTQILSARVANILRTTDTLPQNILCLTFTESGAANMRERLSQFIGQSAYDVTIGTYHAFGGDIIRRYGEYFVDETLSRPIDTLRKHQIVSSIVESLGYNDRLKQTQHHIGDLMSTISEMKRALLTPDDLRKIARENDEYITSLDMALAQIFPTTKLPRNYAQVRALYDQVYDAIVAHEPKTPVNETYGSLARAARIALEAAFVASEAGDKPSTQPLTKWKNKWLAKNNRDQFISASHLENARLHSLANVLESYEAKLRAAELYDFDDMILKAIQVVRDNDELRFTLQEQFQYILLDEYQDTNAAQAELVRILTDNPVNEGRPNVMAVGDDDQAIFAFQGAQFSNMLEFYADYRDTAVVNLSENYRSHADVLSTATHIAEQIDERLFHKFPGTSKTITAANPHITSSHIQRRDFRSQVAESDWVASQIKAAIDEGVNPTAIAVLAPQHKYLESLVPYLRALDIPVRYEKRENILDNLHTEQLITMARLVLAIGHDERIANSLWPNVLSYEFFSVPASTIWQLSWHITDANRREESLTWTGALLTHDSADLRQIAELFIAISQRAESEPCERILDYLIGTTAISTREADESSLVSPMRAHYLAMGDDAMVAMISDMTVLRSKLRDYQQSADEPLHIVDMVALVDAYRAAGELMLNTSPYAEADAAVQLMTAFKSKGLEFDRVFVINTSHEGWGGGGSSNSNKLTLPANLAPTRHSGATEDERLRLFFVALTRAKSHLYLTRWASTFAGKPTSRLKYLDEREQPDGTHMAYVLPESSQTIVTDDNDAPTRESLEYNWQTRHLDFADTDLHELMKPRLATYQLSPTHLNKFCDLIYGGPQEFFVDVLLRFPSAPSDSGEFGNAIHESLEWLQHSVTKQGKLPPLDALLVAFDERLRDKKLPNDETERLIDRGHRALSAYYDQRAAIYQPTDRAETNFRSEGVFIDDAHMTGKIDRLEIDHDAKTITVVDYKTGPSYTKWLSKPSLHKYRQQLYSYKLLVEGSHTYAGYTVTAGRLEFIEPDEHGDCQTLELTFSDDELTRTRQLLLSMWRHVQRFDFPDISDYPATMPGIVQFEKYLLDNIPDKV